MLATSCGNDPPAPETTPSPSQPDAQAISGALKKITTPAGLTYEATTGAAAGYIDDASCAECHSEIAHSYDSVGMSRSFYPMSADIVVEDFENNTLHHQPSGRHYTMSLRNGDMYMARHQLDDVGKRINELEVKVDWVIGSGSHSRYYVYQNQAGEMFGLPVSWYAQTQEWGMAPGFNVEQHDDLDRPITRDCMFCHNAYPHVPVGSDRLGRPHVFPDALPHGIGCQRCHGPGAEHVRIASNHDSTLKQTRESIVNPTNLSLQQQHDVCHQCHLQPTSLLTSFQRRFGRGVYSYTPEEPLNDYLVHIDFDEGSPKDERFEINHHPYRLVQSTCFKESNGALTCMTCHDPHRKVPVEERVEHYKQACFTCHSVDDCDLQAMQRDAGETVSNDCIACHMPTRRTQDVVLVTMTDHLIRRRPHKDNWVAPLPEPSRPEYARAHFLLPDRAPRDVEGELYLALAGTIDGDDTGAQQLDALMHQHDPNFAEPHFVMGEAAAAQGNVNDAEQHLARALTLDAGLAPAVATNRGSLLYRMRRLGEAEREFREALRDLPDSPEAHYNLAESLVDQRRFDVARTHFRKAIELRPNFAKAYFGLAYLAVAQGDLAAAESLFRKALASDPDLHEAYKNLGIVLVQTGQWAEALRYWKHGVGLAHDDGDLHNLLAMALLSATDASLRNAQRALHHALRADELLPGNPQTRLFRALALVRLDAVEEGLALIDDQAVQAGIDQINAQLIRVIALHRLDRADAGMLFYEHLAQSLAGQQISEPFRASLVNEARSLYGGVDEQSDQLSK